MPFNKNALILKNQQRWDHMHMNVHRIPDFDRTARRLCAPDAKARYQAISAGVQAATKVNDPSLVVPWFVVAVIHEREASQRWDRQLGQGDALAHKSVHDPKGRGPFLDHPGDKPGSDAFHRAALDALINCGPYAARWRDWSPGGALTLLEEYNGTGYALRGVPSAYVWSGTDQYVSGKYVADHVYRANVVDVQEGCAPVLARMMALDPTISFQQQVMANAA